MNAAQLPIQSSDTNIVSIEPFLHRQRPATDGTAIPQGDDQIATDSGTVRREPRPPDGTLIARISELARVGEEIVFEDGMRNPVADAVESLVDDYGAQAFDALRASYLKGQLSASTTEEVLLWLGHMLDRPTGEARFSMFVFFLTERDLRVKEAAATALAALGDPRAAPFLQREANNPALPPILGDEFATLAEELSSLNRR